MSQEYTLDWPQSKIFLVTEICTLIELIGVSYSYYRERNKSKILNSQHGKLRDCGGISSFQSMLRSRLESRYCYHSCV